MDNERKQEIINNLEEAMDKATSYENIVAYSRKENNLTQQFLRGFINSQELEFGLTHLKKDFSEAILDTIEELDFALEYLGIPEEDKESIINHETAHYLESIAGGLPARFSLRFDRSNDGRIGFMAGTQMNINPKNNLTENEKRMALRNATAAPNNLSDNDKKIIDLD